MMERRFELIPFPDASMPKIKITGRVLREGSVLTIQFTLSGTVADILFPNLNPHPGRRDGLWLATCFEFFLAFPGRPQYWEFNLSPSGNWNIYRMDAYRQVSFQEEALIQDLHLVTQRGQDCYQLETVVDLSPILAAKEEITIGVASVIQNLDGHETYWALSHPSPQADFHQRESFTLALEG
jgi:hypothetical protein